MRKKFLLFLLPLLLFAQTVQAEKTDIREEIFYDLLIDRFNIGDHDLDKEIKQDEPLAYHGGDILGIINKLDRIEELGYTAIIISPIQKNAKDGYHGYWIEDFYEINDLLGSMDDLKKLIDEAHKREIKVVLELVTNYVAKSHPYVSDEDKKDWFKPMQLTQTDATYWLEEVAVLDQENEEVMDYLIDVATYWQEEVHFDGFKLHDADQSSKVFIEKLSETLKEKDPNFYLLAGVSDQSTNVDSDFLREISTLDGVENFDLFKQINDVLTKPDEPMEKLYEDIDDDSSFPQDILFLDNKNSARFANNFAENGREPILTWELAFTYLYTRPGIPVILQGSELPMYGPSFKESQHLVRFNATNPDIEEFHHRISSLREEFKALTHGDFSFVESVGAMAVIKRTYGNETLYITINNSEESQVTSIEGLESDMELRGLLSDDLVRENRNGEYKISIPRESVEIYKVRPDSGINWLFLIPIVLIMGAFISFMIYVPIKQRREQETQ